MITSGTMKYLLEFTRKDCYRWPQRLKASLRKKRITGPVDELMTSRTVINQQQKKKEFKCNSVKRTIFSKAKVMQQPEQRFYFEYDSEYLDIPFRKPLFQIVSRVGYSKVFYIQKIPWLYRVQGSAKKIFLEVKKAKNLIL